MKAIINGLQVEDAGHNETVVVNGKELKLTLNWINDGEKLDAEFDWTAYTGVQAHTKKCGSRIATELKAGKKVIFTNLSAASVFEVIEAKYGQGVKVTDAIYKRSNTARKESKRAVSSNVKREGGEW